MVYLKEFLKEGKYENIYQVYFNLNLQAAKDAKDSF